MAIFYYDQHGIQSSGFFVNDNEIKMLINIKIPRNSFFLVSDKPKRLIMLLMIISVKMTIFVGI